MAIKITSNKEKIFNVRYVILKERVCVEDDMYAVILFDTETHSIKVERYARNEEMPYYNEAIYYQVAKLLSNTLSENVILELLNNLDATFDDINLADMTLNYSMENHMCVPVKIVGGRKGKGTEGYLLFGEKSYEWNSNNWHVKPTILDVKTRKFIYPTNYAYLEIDENFKRKVNNMISATVKFDDDDYNSLLTVFECKLFMTRHNRERYNSIIREFARRAMETIFTNGNPDVDIIIDAHIAKKRAEYEAKFIKESEKLINWVKENTDKKGDAIEKLARHIFEKHNKLELNY